MTFDYKERIGTKIADRPIGKLLDSLKMESAFFTNSTLSSPWALGMPPMSNCMMFHIVVDGDVLFRSGDAEFSLTSGEFVLFPRSAGHELSDGHCQNVTPLNQLPIKNITERYETLTFGGDGKTTRLICGAVVFEHPLAIKLLGVMPHFIKVDRHAESAMSTIKSISELLKLEAQQIAVGAGATIGRLADILVIAAMRQYLTELDENELGWINALEDDRIGKAIKLIHNQPEKHWSLEDLATAIGMSRTSFANQFKRLVGNTPMEYLTEWRMSLAYSKLQLSQQTVLAIALDIGYQSEAAFSRAFKKATGQSPGEVRRSHQAAR